MTIVLFSAEVSKLKEAFHHQGSNTLQREVKSLRQYTFQLEEQLRAMKGTKEEEVSSSVLKQLGELNIKLTNSQEHAQRLQSQLDMVNHVQGAIFCTLIICAYKS